MLEKSTFLYNFNYDRHHSELSKLEARQLFNKEHTDKLLFSNVEIDPSTSPFIKARLELICIASTYNELLSNIRHKDLKDHGFLVDYLILENDTTSFAERKTRLKDVGYCIDAEPSFNNPSIVFGICTYKDLWYFGRLVKEDNEWHKHSKKPKSFSSSLDIHLAKSLVSIASKGQKQTSLLDACCGVGTVLLEGCIAGFNITGCDINEKACDNTIHNLAFYNYNADVHCCDIAKLNINFDAIIIDLPYNLYSHATNEVVEHIISSATKLAPRLVIVSIADIKPALKTSGLSVTDFCIVEKRGKSRFKRNVWVCEKDS